MNNLNIETTPTNLDDCYNYNFTKMTLKYTNESIFFKNIILKRTLTNFKTDGFNYSIDGIKFPASIKYIKFGYGFNQSLKNIIFPKKLISLKFSKNSEFNESLINTKLPDSITKLTFGKKYNRSLVNVKLPNSLKLLKFGKEYNQCLEHVLFPDSIERIVFGDCFSQSLNNVVFPKLLKMIEFGDEYSCSIDDVIFPNLLAKIKLGLHCKLLLNNLPNTIEEIGFTFIDTEINNLPPSIKIIRFDCDHWDKEINKIKKIPFGCKIIAYGEATDNYYDNLEQINTSKK